MEVFLDTLKQLAIDSGFAQLDWKVLIMFVISGVLIYLAIAKQFEPLLLLPIAFGMLLTNLPGIEMFHSEFYQTATIDYGQVLHDGGLLDILYLGVKLGVYPPLIFLGIGCMTDFGPLIANPKLFTGCSCSGWYLLYLYRRSSTAILYTGRSRCNRYYWWCGWSYRNLCCENVGAAFVRFYCSSSLFLHGFSTGYSATNYESFNYQKRTYGSDGTITTSIQNRKNLVPDYCNFNCFFVSSFRRSIDGMLDVGEPDEGKWRCRTFSKNSPK